MLVTVDDVNFRDGLKCVYVKYKSLTSTARNLPDLYISFAGLNMAVYNVLHVFFYNYIYQTADSMFCITVVHV